MDLKNNYPKLKCLKEENIVDKRQINNLDLLYEDSERPVICAEFTNWKPIRMVRIDEFAKSLA
jgi:hypothetical protein